MTFSVPEENTLGVVITGKGRKRVKQPRRSGRVANSAHRATLGVAYLGLGAALLRAVEVLSDVKDGRLIRLMPDWYADVGGLSVYVGGGESATLVNSSPDRDMRTRAKNGQMARSEASC